MTYPHRSGSLPFLAALALAGACQGAETRPDAAAGGTADTQPWFGERLVRDLGTVASEPVRWDGAAWGIAGACVGGAVAAGILLDRPVQRSSQQHRSAGLDEWSNRVGYLGAIGSFGVIAGTGLGAWAFDSPRLGDATVDALEASIIAAGVITPLIKATAGRLRPRDAGQDSDSFSLFASGRRSFPSGHATQAFAVASAYAGSFPDRPWVGVLGYSAATAVGLSRIEADAHYVSDVVAGALIGGFVGLMTVRLNAERRQQAAHGRHWIPVDVRLATVDEKAAIGVTWRW